MNELIAAHAIAAYALSVNALIEEVNRGRITAQEAQGVITRSRSLVASLSVIDPSMREAADHLLNSAIQLVLPFQTPPTASAH